MVLPVMEGLPAAILVEMVAAIEIRTAAIWATGRGRGARLSGRRVMREQNAVR